MSVMGIYRQSCHSCELLSIPGIISDQMRGVRRTLYARHPHETEDDLIRSHRTSAKLASTYLTTRLKLTFSVNVVPLADLKVPVTVSG